MTNYFRKSGGPAFGLEIGTSAIKAVALAAGGGGVQQAAMTATPAGTLRDGTVVEPQAVAAEIRSLLSRSGIALKQVVTAIPNQAAVIRNITIPRTELKELRGSDMIRYEAERYIPFPIDEVTLDFDVLDDPANVPADGSMEVVIAAVPNETVNRHVETLQLAGLQPVIVDVKSFAALRAIGQRQAAPDEVTLTLEIGASSSVIGLVRGERLLMSRNINISADDFTTSLQQAFDLDFVTAENLKLNYQLGGNAAIESPGGQTFSPARMTDILRPRIIDLITEVRRSLEFYRVQSGDLIIDQMVLAGGGAKLSGLADAMSEALGVPTEVAQPWQNLSLPANADELRLHGPEYAVPIGLALRGVSRG